jgi:hypothetical protein
MTEPELSKEERILRMMKRVLTDVARDTAPTPGLRHPLSEDTIQGIRECLVLISSRERELAEQHGREMNDRPRFIDEPKSEVVVPLDVNSMKKNLQEDDE